MREISEAMLEIDEIFRGYIREAVQHEREAHTKFVSALLSLLDRIELQTDDTMTHALCKQRFQIAKDHGLTVEFGEPASGVVQ